MSARARDIGPFALGSVWYAVPPIALAWDTAQLQGLALVLLPLFAWSWLQDWISCEIAATYHAGRLALFDLVTACNYVALVRALEHPPSDPWRLSDAACLHWGLVFAIYIAWNLQLAGDSDSSTRRMMRRFAAAESVALCLAIVLWSQGPSLSGTGYAALVVLLAAMHASLLFAWRRSSREPAGEPAATSELRA